jgi:hypothetical protein
MENVQGVKSNATLVGNTKVLRTIVGLVDGRIRHLLVHTHKPRGLFGQLSYICSTAPRSSHLIPARLQHQLTLSTLAGTHPSILSPPYSFALLFILRYSIISCDFVSSIAIPRVSGFP